MSELIQTIVELTLAYADREARWLNRYNRLQPNGTLELEWGYKEAFYQTRFVELLRLIPHHHLEKLHSVIAQKMEKLSGEAERNRSPEGLERLIQALQRSPSPPVDS